MQFIIPAGGGADQMARVIQGIVSKQEDQIIGVAIAKRPAPP
ncbi:MAG: hypothetical protein JWP04_2052 [Belnapia sp.]|nr:hypothetical protein [Belnapia sp.]